MPAAKDEATPDPMQDHVPFIHAEVEERLGAILVQDEDRGLLRFRGKREPGVDAIVGGGDGPDRGIPAIPVVEVLQSMRVRERPPFPLVPLRRGGRIGEAQGVGHRLARLRVGRGGGIVHLVRAARGQDRQVRADLRGLGLEEQVVVLGDERKPREVPRPESHEALTALELEIRLVADEALEPIDLIRAVGRDPDPRIEESRGG